MLRFILCRVMFRVCLNHEGKCVKYRGISDTVAMVDSANPSTPPESFSYLRLSIIADRSCFYYYLIVIDVENFIYLAIYSFIVCLLAYRKVLMLNSMPCKD